MRRPAPATIIATIALVLAAAPAGVAANGWVKRARLRATPAPSTASAPHASRTRATCSSCPTSRRLPASILPARIGGPRGPASPPGAAGAAGTDGSGATAVVANAGARRQRGRRPDRRGDAAAQGRVVRARRQGEPRRHHRWNRPRRRHAFAAGTDGDQVDTDLSRARTTPWRSSPPTPSRQPESRPSPARPTTPRGRRAMRGSWRCGSRR